jgi:hypothetical protein
VKAALPLLLLLVSACREEPITRVREPKEPSAAMSAAPVSPSKARGLSWTTPKGWIERPGDGMRAATLIPPGRGRAEVTVIALPGDVGGELANVNRWRGQLGLPQLEEGALAGERRELGSRAGAVSLYDFTSGGAPKTRLVAAALRVGETTWFFKLMGDEAAAAAARPAFIALLEGLHGDAL